MDEGGGVNAEEIFRQARERGKVRREHWEDGEYLRLLDEFHGLPRGTVKIADTLLCGYPRIGRILRLASGLREVFSAPFFVEEKVDGYNVRVVRVGERVLAFTRGGFLCPFTTDRLADLIDTSFFEIHPGLVICMEVAGPDNPYLRGTTPQVTEDVRAFVFDIARKGRVGFLPYAEKLALLERHRLPSVQRYGRFTVEQVEALRSLLWRLNEEQREGVVMKEDSAQDRRIKYVTSNSSVADIRNTVHNLLHLPPEYFIHRILRLALFRDEVGREAAEDIAERLGHAFLDGLDEAIAQYRREGKVYYAFRCRLRDPANADRLLAHIRRGDRRMHVVETARRSEGGYTVLEFRKVYDDMTGLLAHLMRGGQVFD